MPEDLFTYIGAFVAVVLAFLLFTWTRRSAAVDVRPSMPTHSAEATPPVPPSMSRPRTPFVPTTTRVAITHPMIRRAAERALKQGGETAKYVCREGDTIYLTFDALPDPAQRQRAIEMLRKIQDADEDAGDIGVAELLALLRQMFGTSKVHKGS